MPEFIVISQRNLPYRFSDFKPDNLPLLKFIPEDMLGKRGVDEFVQFEEFEIDSDTASVIYFFAPGHTCMAVVAFQIKQCDVTLIDLRIAFVNRIKFLPPEDEG